jgi:nucleotide-binding universal stress UspA family protein
MTKISFRFDNRLSRGVSIDLCLLVEKLYPFCFVMAKSIICVVDFSESSQQVLQCAADLSATFHSHLSVLYPYRLLQTTRGEDLMELKKRKEKEAIQQFESLEKRLLAGRDLDVDFSSEIGFVTDRIENRTRQNPAQFVVIGRSLVNANKESFDEMMKHLPSPLVIVP